MDEERSVYTLDEALASVGFGKFQGFALAYAGLGLFAEAMEMMILSFVGPAVKSQWRLSSSQESLLTTTVFAGMLLGAYFWGIISDKYGRRRGFLGVTLTGGAGLLSSLSPNYTSLVILRFLVGFGLGGTPVFYSWFLEFVPPSYRGAWMIVFSTFWTFGTIAEASLAWVVMPRMSWRWLLAFSSIPSICLLLLYCCVPESPRYLCIKGRVSDASKILNKIASLNRTKLPSGMLTSGLTTRLLAEESTSLGHTPVVSTTRKTILGLKSGFSSFLMLFSSKLILTTQLLWVLFFGNAFLYYGIILLTSELSSGQSKCSSTVLHLETNGDNRLYIDVFITSLAELPGLLLSGVLVDIVGRKYLMALMFVAECIFLFPLISHQSVILTTTLLFGARMCAIGTFTVASVYVLEVYPTTSRATGAGAANAVGRIGGMVCPLVAVGLVTGCHLSKAILLFEFAIIISAICSLLFALETKGRELTENFSYNQEHTESSS